MGPDATDFDIRQAVANAGQCTAVHHTESLQRLNFPLLSRFVADLQFLQLTVSRVVFPLQFLDDFHFDRFLAHESLYPLQLDRRRQMQSIDFVKKKV